MHAALQDAADASAVLVYRSEGVWQADLLPSTLGEDLDGLVDALRQQPGDGGGFALVDVAHEFFVVVRLAGGAPRMLLSDVTAAVAWDLARDVCDAIDVPVPADEDLDDVLPAGDLGIFDDLGLDAMEMGMVLSDVDLYADEMLTALSRRLGFAEAWDRVVVPGA